MLDITNREDLEKLVRSFYERTTIDPLIGHYFKEVVTIDWDLHIPVIVNFWENILFSTGGYKGGMMYKHMNLNYLSAFKTIHFNRWLEIWNTTVDQYFKGPRAEEVKFRANSIAIIMQSKLGVSQADDINNKSRP